MMGAENLFKLQPYGNRWGATWYSSYLGSVLWTDLTECSGCEALLTSEHKMSLIKYLSGRNACQIRPWQYWIEYEWILWADTLISVGDRRQKKVDSSVQCVSQVRCSPMSLQNSWIMCALDLMNRIIHIAPISLLSMYIELATQINKP